MPIKQKFLPVRLRKSINYTRVRFEYTTQKTTSYLIGDILIASRTSGQEDRVALHLVGAALQLRFPEISVSNNAYSSVDELTGSQGNFKIHDTEFYVIVSPLTPVYKKCVANLDNGKSVLILIPARFVAGAKMHTDVIAGDRIDVAAIESFVGFNVDEIAKFGKGASTRALLKLLEIYNVRVKEVETDLSLMIDIPKNLSG